MVPLAVERNVNKDKDAVLNHNCRKVAVWTFGLRGRERVG